MPYIVVSNLNVVSVTVESSDTAFSIVKLPDGARIRIRNSRVFPTYEEAAKSIKQHGKPNQQIELPNTSRQTTPYDYGVGGRFWKP